MEGETNRDDSCPEGFDSPEGSPNRHGDRLVSLGQINRCWDHDYDWLLLDDDSSAPPEPCTTISPVHYTESSSPIQHFAALLLPGERGYRTCAVTADIIGHTSELDPLNYFQIDWSYTPRNDHVCWIPFPRTVPFHEEPSAEEDRLVSREYYIFWGEMYI